jgi:hypothetical protein
MTSTTSVSRQAIHTLDYLPPCARQSRQAIMAMLAWQAACHDCCATSKHVTSMLRESKHGPSWRAAAAREAVSREAEAGVARPGPARGPSPARPVPPTEEACRSLRRRTRAGRVGLSRVLQGLAAPHCLLPAAPLPAACCPAALLPCCGCLYHKPRPLHQLHTGWRTW